jgi:hypothetical protein
MAVTESPAPAQPAPPAHGAHAPVAVALSSLDKLLANPLVGLSPWILYSVLEGPGRLELSAALAAGLAVFILSLNWIRGSSPKILEFSDVVYFVALTIIVAFVDPGTHRWLELYGGEVANVAVFAIAFGSILVRQPFTLQYAREQEPREVWHEPEFLRVNYLITWVWVAAFAIEAASGAYGDLVLRNSNNIWTGWIIQTLPLIIAAQFTIWYPNRLDAIREGRHAADTTVSAYLGTVTPWITITGIIVLSVGGTPESVGIALLAAGIVLTKVFTQQARPERAPA